MKLRLPLVPTILVGLAVAAMIALGFWQIARLHEKEALLARLSRNMTAPETAFPRDGVGDELLFRRAGAFCLQVTGWRHEGGGAQGYRVIAECRSGAEGPMLPVMLGANSDPNFEPDWHGGEVHGILTHLPMHQSLIGALFAGSTPKPLMLVLDKPPAGLSAVEKPSIDSVPNNHLAYAVQWFLFAIIAVVIYLLALRRRQVSKD